MEGADRLTKPVVSASGSAVHGGVFEPPIPALTGLRFFAVLFVVLEHAFGWLAPFPDALFSEFFTVLSNYGMSLFFVLSGFVIHYNYRRLFQRKPLLRAAGEFAAARFARLYPLYLCFFVVALLGENFVGYATQHPDSVPTVLLNYLVLTQSWSYLIVNGQLLTLVLFGLSWSISTEMFFYAAYVPATFALRRMKRPGTAITVSAVYTVLVIALLIVCWFKFDWMSGIARNELSWTVIGAENFVHSLRRWLFYFSPYTRIAEFFIGCLAGQVLAAFHGRPVTRAERRIGVGVVALAMSAIVGWAIVFTLVRIGKIQTYPTKDLIAHLTLNFGIAAPAMAALMFCVCRYDGSVLSRWLSFPVLVTLGDMSYSIYLVHAWVFLAFRHGLGPFSLVTATEAVVRVVVAIVAAVIAASATYRLIEVPARRWLRRRLVAS